MSTSRIPVPERVQRRMEGANPETPRAASGPSPLGGACRGWISRGAPGPTITRDIGLIDFHFS